MRNILLSSSTTPSAQHIPFPLSFLIPHLQQASPPLQIEGDFFKKDHASILSAQLHHTLVIPVCFYILEVFYFFLLILN